MKLLINGIRGGDCVRSITNALLDVDLGARVNFNLEAQLVRIEGRLTVGDATTAIERGGFRVASVVDDTVVDAVFRAGRREVLVL
ncbi:heavy-metal-associated domain-containing protein [Lysobacter niabensis]|uniref:heavy-metal-associated domain-containing protein n=1 Tax=Agrilutibacter niabensis TaxID=380628 RepID=UPI00360DF86D